MTIRDTLKGRLFNLGMFPNHAEAVMLAVCANADPVVRWNDEIEGYPPALIAALWLDTKHEAVKWIDAYLPRAFYKPLLVDRANPEETE
jgi:hypothetical protein